MGVVVLVMISLCAFEQQARDVATRFPGYSWQTRTIWGQELGYLISPTTTRTLTTNTSSAIVNADYWGSIEETQDMAEVRYYITA
jgi:hypothetical protein